MKQRNLFKTIKEEFINSTMAISTILMAINILGIMETDKFISSMILYICPIPVCLIPRVKKMATEAVIIGVFDTMIPVSAVHLLMSNVPASNGVVTVIKFTLSLAVAMVAFLMSTCSRSGVEVMGAVIVKEWYKVMMSGVMIFTTFYICTNCIGSLSFKSGVVVAVCYFVFVVVTYLVFNFLVNYIIRRYIISEERRIIKAGTTDDDGSNNG